MRGTGVSAVVLAAALVTAKAAPFQQNPAVTTAERLAAWKNQKVTILSNRPSWCTGSKNEAPSLFWKESSPDKRISADRYAGRSGTIVEVATQPETRVVIELDAPTERIVARDDHGLGFQAELETAKTWVGRALWSNGAQTIAPLGFECQSVGSGGERTALKNLEKVQVTAAEAGTHLQHVLLRVKTANGTEGWLDGWEGYDMVDERFHIPNPYGVATRPYSYRFHLDDPRKGRESWKPAVWQLIEGGNVAIGMTEEMAKLACGRFMESTGFVLSQGSDVATIYRCGGKSFQVEKGSVTKYVDSR